MPAQPIIKRFRHLSGSNGTAPAGVGGMNGTLPLTPSSQQLVNSNKSSEEDIYDPKVDLLVPQHFIPVNENAAPAKARSTSMVEWCAVFILFFVNLINYMDRLTIAGKFSKVMEGFPFRKVISINIEKCKN